MRLRLKGVHFSITAILLMIFGVAAHRPAAAPHFSEWSSPINLGSVVNSRFNDQGPAISKDGRNLYFTSDRIGGFGGNDIWVSERASVDSPWGVPMNLGSMINTAFNEGSPALSRDEHWLFMNSNRPGGIGRGDLWAAWRPNPHDAFGWEPAANLGRVVNSTFADTEAGYFENEEGGSAMLFFSSDRPGGLGSWDLYVATQAPDGSFGPPILLSELNSAFNDARPSIRFDGLEIFFYSGRPGGLGLEDLWVATRNTPSDTWSMPINLGAVVNSSFFEVGPYIAPDRRTLYFASDRPGGQGATDLYFTTRGKLPQDR